MCILSGLYQKIFSNFGLQYPKLIWFQIQSRFVDRYLISSTGLVLESLHFKSDQQCSDLDVGFWIITTVKRGLCETSRLPQSLYTCRTLVVLTLQNVSLVDVQFPVYMFQIAQNVRCTWMRLYFLRRWNSEEDIIMLPYSEILDLVRAENDNVRSFSILCFHYKDLTKGLFVSPSGWAIWMEMRVLFVYTLKVQFPDGSSGRLSNI